MGGFIDNTDILYHVMDCSLGRLFVAWCRQGVCGVGLGDSDREVIASFARRWPRARLQRSPSRGPWGDTVGAIADGAGGEVPVVLSGTPFQREVWQALQQIPSGDRWTYQQVAVAIGRPNASRAVGLACGANPVALLVPCHRVVRGDGRSGGYHWGTARKRVLIERESR